MAKTKTQEGAFDFSGATADPARELVQKTVTLERGQAKALKLIAAEEETSVSAILRGLIDGYLGKRGESRA